MIKTLNNSLIVSLKNLSIDEILFGFWGYWTSWIHRYLEVERDKEDG